MNGKRTLHSQKKVYEYTTRKEKKNFPLNIKQIFIVLSILKIIELLENSGKIFT